MLNEQDQPVVTEEGPIPPEVIPAEATQEIQPGQRPMSEREHQANQELVSFIGFLESKYNVRFTVFKASFGFLEPPQNHGQQTV